MKTIPSLDLANVIGGAARLQALKSIKHVNWSVTKKGLHINKGAPKVEFDPDALGISNY